MYGSQISSKPTQIPVAMVAAYLRPAEDLVPVPGRALPVTFGHARAPNFEQPWVRQVPRAKCPHWLLSARTSGRRKGNQNSVLVFR